MTTVYGVTFIGAKNQIQRQLKDRGDIPAEHLYTCSLYLGRLVLDSIGDIFKGATGIQTWLNRCARLIAKSIPPQRIQAALQEEAPKRVRKNSTEDGKQEQDKASRATPAPKRSRIPKEQMTSVIWTTPLGLPVVQPYRKPKKRQVQTALQTVFIVDPSIPAEVDARAQATAFPPNFIHSLDATHMMMTALACKDKIAFASVHDSYWTHAADVDEMSTILRDTFVELHSQDILGRLRQEVRLYLLSPLTVSCPAHTLTSSTSLAVRRPLRRPRRPRQQDPARPPARPRGRHTRRRQAGPRGRRPRRHLGARGGGRAGRPVALRPVARGQAGVARLVFAGSPQLALEVDRRRRDRVRRAVARQDVEPHRLEARLARRRSSSSTRQGRL